MVQPAKQFWNWFKQNNAAYLFLHELDADTKEQFLNNLMEQLHQYCDQLYFEVGGLPDADQELIITAEGDSNYFERVETLVQAAPKIDRWQFTAFIPPRALDFKINYEDVVLNQGEMWFLPLQHEDNPASIGVRVCTMNFELVKDSEWLRPAVYKTLDTILGEKSFALDIDYVAIDQLPDNPEDEGMMQLSELREYVAWRKAKYKVS